MKNVMAFAPQFNSPGKHDATGAFQPDAHRYLLLRHGSVATGDVKLFNNRRGDASRRRYVLNELASRASFMTAEQQIDGVAFFCHGSKGRIQAGFRVRDLPELARALAALNPGRDNLVVTLYACDCARDLDKDRKDDLEELGGDGGFADELRDALCRAGQVHCRVDAHTTAGDDDQNPNVRRFEGNGSATGGTGGHYIVPLRRRPPEARRRWRRWFEAVRTTDFRWRYPFMADAEIMAYLEDPPIP